MSPTQLLTHFDRIIEAPDAVSRLRQLVLDLAVRGKLVDQKGSDAPASEMLGDRVKRLPAAESPWLLPSGWSWSTLALLGETVGGGTPSKGTSAFWKGSIPWVSPKDMKTDVISDAQDHISENAVAESAVQLIPASSLLIVVRGMILAHSFPTAISTVQVTINQDMKAIVPFRRDIVRMLQMILKGMKSSVLRLVQRSTHGTCRLPTDDLFGLPIPVPPLLEQHRIIAKIEELMSFCDRLEATQAERERRRDRVTAASLSRLNQPSSKVPTFREHARFQLDHLHRFITQPRHVEQLRQTIVNLAARGRLLGGIGVIQGRGNKVGDFVSFLNGYAFESKSFVSRGVRLCRNVNVGHGSLNWRPANSAHVSEATAAEFQRYRLTAGDIVLSLDRPLISTGLKAAKIRQDDLPCLLLQRVGKAEFLSNDVDPDFFLLWLQSSDFTTAIDPGRSKGVPHISTRQVESIGFIPPDRPEQERIVAEVNELMVICDRLESSLTTSQAESRRLLEAVLRNALASTSVEGLEVARNPMYRIAVARRQRP